MKTLLNLIWLVLAGFWLALGYVLAGIICCILIVTIPFGIASFRMASYALRPFGRTVVDKPTAGALSVIGRLPARTQGPGHLRLCHAQRRRRAD